MRERVSWPEFCLKYINGSHFPHGIHSVEIFLEVLARAKLPWRESRQLTQARIVNAQSLVSRLRLEGDQGNGQPHNGGQHQRRQVRRLLAHRRRHPDASGAPKATAYRTCIALILPCLTLAVHYRLAPRDHRRLGPLLLRGQGRGLLQEDYVLLRASLHLFRNYLIAQLLLQTCHFQLLGQRLGILIQELQD